MYFLPFSSFRVLYRYELPYSLYRDFERGNTARNWSLRKLPSQNVTSQSTIDRKSWSPYDCLTRQFIITVSGDTQYTEDTVNVSTMTDIYVW